MWIYIWLGVLALALIIEFVTLELVSVWIGVGALVAMIIAACGVQMEIQIAVFVVVSVACILGLRKITLKWLGKNKGNTNLDAIIGTQHRVIKPITIDDPGTIKVNGVEWNAKTQKPQNIEAGSLVEILEVQGNKFIVKKVEEEPKAEPIKEEKTEKQEEPKEETKEAVEKEKVEKKEKSATKKVAKTTTSKQTKKAKGE